jgi:hypothetical protein
MVQPKANQNAPIVLSYLIQLIYLIGMFNEPIVPKTTHGKVLPRINSRILVRTSSPPPRKIIGPLDTEN